MLRTLRTSKDLGLRELAKKAKVPPGYLADLEAGKKKNPSPVVLKRLAKVLGVSPGYLLSQHPGGISDMINELVLEAITVPGAEAVVHGLTQCVRDGSAPRVGRYSAEKAIEKLHREQPGRRHELKELHRLLDTLYARLSS